MVIKITAVATIYESLPPVRYCVRCCAYAIFGPQKPYCMAVIFHILQVKKLRIRETEYKLAWGHTGDKAYT